MAEVKVGLIVDTASGEVRMAQFAKSSKSAFNKVGRNGTSAFNKIGRGVGSTFKKLTSLKGLLVSIGGLYVFKRIAESFVEAASATENYGVRLKHLLGSQMEGNRLFKELGEYASRVPFAYEKIMDAGVQLSGVMKGGVNEIKEWLPLIGDLAAVSGLTIEKTTEQVVRMYSAGAGAADLFRERGITAMLGFKAGATYTVEETRKRMKEEWGKMGSQFRGATGDLALTWKGTLSMFGDLWFQFRTKVMGSGVFDFIKAGANEVLKTVQNLNTEGTLDVWAAAISDKAIGAIQMLVSVSARLPGVWYTVLEVMTTVGAGVIKVFNGILWVMEKFYKALALIPKFGAPYRELAGDIGAVRGELGKTGDELADNALKHHASAVASEVWRDKTVAALEAVRVKALETSQATASVVLGGGAGASPTTPPLLTPEAIAEAKSALANLEAPEGEGVDDVFARAKLEYDTKLEALKNYHGEKLTLMAAAGANEATLVRAQADMEIAFAKKKKEFSLGAAGAMAGGVSNILQNLMVATGSKNKAMFKAMKAFSIAEAIISTAAGAARAFKDVPYPFNFVASASIIAAGMAQVKKISSTQPGSAGGAISAGGAATPSYGGGSATAYPVPERQEQGRGTQTVNVSIYALDPANVDMLAITENSIIPAFEKLSGEMDVELNIKVVERESI